MSMQNETPTRTLARFISNTPSSKIPTSAMEKAKECVLDAIGCRRLRSEGMAILLVEQNLHLALELADKVYIMTKGRVVYEGLPEELAGDDRTKEEQLGIGGDQGPDFMAGQPQ
jgi:ABC-type branched-subunit amino acid transport system ATPase component